MVRQISVFIENVRGSLSKLTRTLGRAGVDLIALSVADSEHYGIVRMIAGDADIAVEALRSAGYTVKTTDVLAVCVPDRPGGLSEVLGLLGAADISVEYIYSFVRRTDEGALIIFRVSDLEKAARILGENDVRLLSQDEVQAL